MLSSKFQTDSLEARFGQYRQFSGGNYHVTTKQILEVEKKIRTKNYIILNGKNITPPKIDQENDLNKLNISFQTELDYSENDFEALV